MSSAVVNVFDGSVWLSPSLPAGYGVSIPNPAQTLADLITDGIYYREVGLDSDVILINAGDTKMISIFKSLTAQKLMQQFVARCSFINGQDRIRWVHRSLAISLNTGEALKCVGEGLITVSDDFSDMTTINQQLAPHFLQFWSAP